MVICDNVFSTGASLSISVLGVPTARCISSAMADNATFIVPLNGRVRWFRTVLLT